MRKGAGRQGPSALPVPKSSRGSPSPSLTREHTNYAHSAEDLTRSGGSLKLAQNSLNASNQRRALSPGSQPKKGYSSMHTSQAASLQAGVRYITVDLIRKCAKEENLEMIHNLNLTLSKDGGKKIKYIENLEKLSKVQVLNLSHNAIERMEKLERLQHLRELNLAHNCLARIEGIESLVKLQVLNVSDNRIEHIPVWLPKRLQALRTLRIADNQLTSLSELGKLKGIPDLIQLDISGNPLSDLPHSRLYIIFHLRCVEILDGQQVSASEREKAQNRFALDEVQTLERQLEQEESKYRQLEESHNRSEQERSQQELSQNESRLRERQAQEMLKQLQQELQAKENLLKHKTKELNKACEKHYQLEQELAFYKIDSKFQSLGEAPPPPTDLSSDDGGFLEESPYLGRARFKANQRAEERQYQPGTPQRVQVHSIKGLSVSQSVPPLLDPAQQAEMDKMLEEKKRQLASTEDRLRSLQQDLSQTEQKLLNATEELKKLAPNRATPEPFRDNKFKIRQKLAKKMQTVNQMRDNATQIEGEIDHIQQSVTQDHTKHERLKAEMKSLDTRSPIFSQKQRELQSLEQQINQGHGAYEKKQQDLRVTLNTIAQETSEIKNLEELLTGDLPDQNETSVKSELEDVVSGLQSYLEGVKGQSLQQQLDFQRLEQEKEALAEKVRRMEAELSILDTEAQTAKVLQKQLHETEKELNRTQSASQNLEDDLQKSRHRDQEIQDRLEEAESEVKRLNQSLSEVQKRSQAEKVALERQLQAERERLEKMTQRVQDANRQDLEAKKLMAQLEAAKALSTSLRDQVDELQQKQHQEEDGSFKPSELKKRLRKFTHDFKTNKNPGEPVNKDDILGSAFKEIYQAAQDKLNKSVREVDEVKKIKSKAEAEIQTMKQKLQEAQAQVKNLDNKKADEEKKQMQEEIRRLQANLKQLKEGGVPVRIVYAPSDGSGDRASSLDSEEKLLFDELQRELMELKQHMRQQDFDASRKVTEAETEAAHWQEELKAQQQQFEEELEKHRLEAELLREKQEARIQVIAADLDQAQFTADALQNALRQREAALQEELSAAELSNQMMSVQEDELARLYDILEAQRGEIENLNQMLDYLATQGPDGVGPGFDDELWRIRQEVNKLKETLAMQSAYVQSMPSSQAMGTQAGLPPPFLSSLGVGGGPGGNGESARGSSGTVAGGDGRSRPSSYHGFSTGVPLMGSALPPASAGPAASSMPRQGLLAGRSPAAASLPQLQQSAGVPANPRTNFDILGNERRESKVPTGRRLSIGRKGQVAAGQQSSRTSEGEFSTSRQHSEDRHRHAASAPSAFEPVHPRSEGFIPLAPAASGNRPQLAGPASGGHSIQPQQGARQGAAANAGSNYAGLSLGVQTPAVQGADRGSQVSKGFTAIHPVAGAGRQQTAVVPVPVPAYAAPPPAVYQPAPVHPVAAGHLGAAGHSVAAGPVHQPVQVIYPGTQDAGMTYSGGPQVAFDPIATQYVYSDMGGRGGAEGGGRIPPGYGPLESTGIADVGTISIPGSYGGGGTVPAAGYGLGAGGGGGGMPSSYMASRGGPGGYAVSGGQLGPYEGSAGAVPGNSPYAVPSAASLPVVYNYGSQAYIPAGPGQRLTYQPARTFLPASAGSGHGARVYYPAGAPIPVPAPAPFPMPVPNAPHPPPPPPGLAQQPVAMVGPPPPVMYSVPVMPIAAGTPVRGGAGGREVPVNFDGSFAVYPPSPIRNSGMESPARGILKNSNTSAVGAEESYLFCNVPEHHDLEDYIAELQEKLRRLRGKLLQEKDIKLSLVEDNERKSMKRLLNELEDRRDELEGLDLAIERQKRSLKEMKKEERSLKRERTDVRGELEKLRDKNNKKIVKIVRRAEDDSFDEAMEKSRQRYLQDETDCLERTLAKRRAQLREAEMTLKETNADLKVAKEQTKETVKRYDDATASLHSALSEQQEIERRANEVGAKLVKNLDQLAAVTSDLKQLERKRSKQERLLKDINQVISKKDTEFKELDSKVKATQQSLQRLQEELALLSQREKETVDALRDSEDILSKRRAEIARIREQVEGQRSELERLDQQVGRKKTELQLLQESQDRRQAELSSLLREAEAELSSKQREIKEDRAELEQLSNQKADLISTIKTRRQELHKLQEEVQQEEEVLQRLTSSVNKNKSELKHTYEMEKLEQTELENLRAQHTAKMADIERAQRELIEEKSELEQLTAETSRKSAELERLRQCAEKERGDVNLLSSEKTKLEEKISALLREQGMLEDSCHSMDDKLNTVKRSLIVNEEKLEGSSRRLRSLEEQLADREKEMEDANLQRTILQKDVQMLKQNIKDSQSELQQLQENITDAEASLSNLRQDLRAEQQKRDAAHAEVERLSDAIRSTSSSYEDAVRQERAKQEELHDLIRSIEDREREHDDARKALGRVRKEIEKEENKLNKVLSSANTNLEQVRSDLAAKQEELDKVAQSLAELKKEAGQLQADGKQFVQLQETIQDLEKEMEERSKEKNELANALSVSFEEVQRLRKESSEARETLRKDHAEYENALKDIQRQLAETKQGVDILCDDKENTRVSRRAAVDIMCDDKENMRVSRRAAAVLAKEEGSDNWMLKHGQLRERLVEEQDYLRFQLKQQMTRHNEIMESARKKSDETIDHLKQKLNSLQEVLFNSDIHTLRSRSQSPVRLDRKRSPSPAQRFLIKRSRSRSFERMGSPMIPERDYL